MGGNPRYQINVPALVFHLAHQHARRAGFSTTSDWLRALLLEQGDHPLTPRPRRTYQLSVRLSPPLQARLAYLAQVSETSMSEAFAILIENALIDAADVATAETPRPERKSRKSRSSPETGEASPSAPAIPGFDDHERWATEILDAARRTPHKFGADKAFIAGVLDELVSRFQPADPHMFRDRVRALLPVLNRRGLVGLTRADLVASMDPALVQDSAVPYMNTVFHFVDLG